MITTAASTTTLQTASTNPIWLANHYNNHRQPQQHGTADDSFYLHHTWLCNLRLIPLPAIHLPHSPLHTYLQQRQTWKTQQNCYIFHANTLHNAHNVTPRGQCFAGNPNVHTPPPKNTPHNLIPRLQGVQNLSHLCNKVNYSKK